MALSTFKLLPSNRDDWDVFDVTLLIEQANVMQDENGICHLNYFFKGSINVVTI